MPKKAGGQGTGLTLTRTTEGGDRETVDLARLTWPVWTCKIVEVGAGELARLTDRAWAVWGGLRPSSLKRPPGPLFLPLGLWTRGRLPPPLRRYPAMRESERALSHALRVDPANQKAILEFVNTWGWPGVGTAELPVFPFDEVGRVQNFLTDLQAGLRTLWAILKEEWSVADWHFPLVEGVPDSKRGPYYWQMWRHWLHQRLQGEIPGLGEGVHLGLHFEPDGRRQWSLQARTLADALWAALLFRAATPEPMVECKNCHHPFIPSRADQEFCPPGPDDVRSPCLNAWTVREWRKKKKKSAQVAQRRARKG